MFSNHGGPQDVGIRLQNHKEDNVEIDNLSESTFHEYSVCQPQDMMISARRDDDSSVMQVEEINETVQ